MKAKINKTAVDAMGAGGLLIDTEVRGFVARKLPSGRVSFGFRYWVAGQRRWLPLGLLGEITADQARTKAEKARGRVADDRDPLRERDEQRAAARAARKADANTVDSLLDAFLARHVRKNLRSAGEVERSLDKYVRPRIGKISVYALKRSDIVKMLDGIEDKHGPVMADRTLAHVRKAFNWHATRDADFNSPIVKGMGRTKPAERARKRVLNDDEIRDLWKALETFDRPEVYSRLVRTLLLSAQRRDEIAGMRWRDIEDDVLTIAPEDHKTGRREGAKAVPLTARIVEQLGKPMQRGYVFSTTAGSRPFSGFAKAKARLDKRINALRKADRRKPIPHWTLHDLRRTARSLMSRAGVPSEHAELALGHVLTGVKRTYDRYEYVAERRDALERLGRLIAEILEPPSDDNVVPLRPAAVASA